MINGQAYLELWTGKSRFAWTKEKIYKKLFFSWLSSRFPLYKLSKRDIKKLITTLGHNQLLFYFFGTIVKDRPLSFVKASLQSEQYHSTKGQIKRSFCIFKQYIEKILTRSSLI